MTAFFSIPHAAHDEPESKKVAGVKGKHTNMPMVCTQCVCRVAFAA